jgi:hypothetical protein
LSCEGVDEILVASYIRNEVTENKQFGLNGMSAVFRLVSVLDKRIRGLQ